MTITSSPSSASRRSLDASIVRVLTAVIGVHVVDDNFLQPNTGTSPADHLLGGLVPLALLVGAAVAYPRLRPFPRGVTALLVGAFGIAVGLEGWYYALSVGPSGDDFTGMVCVPAGAALLALAAVTLWRGRRIEGSLPRRCGRERSSPWGPRPWASSS
jgi:MYXO-CTERM domain-containing protein